MTDTRRWLNRIGAAVLILLAIVIGTAYLMDQQNKPSPAADSKIECIRSGRANC